jgi:hypothetical protein
MSNPNHDEELYAQAAAELEDGNRDEGLWAKCFAECDGEENKAKARYIKTRAERLGQSNNETLIQKEESDKESDKEANLTKGRIWKKRIWFYGGAFAIAIIIPTIKSYDYPDQGIAFIFGEALGIVFAAWLMAGLPYLYYRLTENKLTRFQYRSCFVAAFIIWFIGSMYVEEMDRPEMEPPPHPLGVSEEDFIPVEN